jgi:hypothetical protein
MGATALVADKFAEVSELARVLAGDDLNPRAMVYAAYSDASDEKLLFVPATKKFDEREIYRKLSLILARQRDKFPYIDVSDVRVVSDEEPYIKGLSSLFRVEGFSTVTISKSVLNGVYIEHAVVYRMTL